ncbi:hypothetical protein [Acinetobacter gerneri]|uniref:hypothetical protein n=1 Tax=Acinetobacter gerneri TaxID=202952 RepID=UPI0028A5C80D|nr:hypothetical protein [Acinetobacter gerneri]
MNSNILDTAVLTDVSALQNGSALLLTVDGREPILIRNPDALPAVLAGNFDLSVGEAIEASSKLLARIGLKIKGEN